MRPDYRRIHELEYALGFREDPPAPEFSDAPGAVFYFDPKKESPRYVSSPQSVTVVSAGLKEIWTA